MRAGCSLGYRERHDLGLSGEDVVIRINQVDPHRVLTGREPSDVDRVEVARVRPPPRQVVDLEMEMPNPR
jgi:hypothetical protein